MKAVIFPEGYTLESISKRHPRKNFSTGIAQVDDWLRTKALQNYQKHLSVTKVLLTAERQIVGFYTISSGQVDFNELPPDIVHQLPRRVLPVAVLAWLGVDQHHQGRGLGTRLLAQALRDCYQASATFPFIAILLDCVNEEAKAFYKQWQFQELPGHPYRLYLSWDLLQSLMNPS